MRSGLLVLCVAAAAGLMVSAEVIESGGRRALGDGIERMGADLVAVPRGLTPEMTRSFTLGEAQVFYMDGELERRIAGFDFVERTSAQLFVKSLSQAACCSSWNVLLIGFDPQTDFTIKPWLERGGGGTPGPDEVLVGAMMPVPESGKVKFYGRGFTVAGRLAKSGMGLDAAVFIPLESARRMAAESAQKAEKTLEIGPDEISAVMIRLKPEAKGGLPGWKAAYKLESAIPEISIIQPDDLAKRATASLRGGLKSVRAAGYTVWAVTAVLLGLIFSLAQNERGREIGLFRAMGAGRGFVFAESALEAMAVTAAGAVAGILAALGLTRGFSILIAEKLETPFLWPEGGTLMRLCLLALVLAVITGAAASLPSALRSALMEPQEAIRREE